EWIRLELKRNLSFAVRHKGLPHYKLFQPRQGPAIEGVSRRSQRRNERLAPNFHRHLCTRDSASGVVLDRNHCLHRISHEYDAIAVCALHADVYPIFRKTEFFDAEQTFCRHLRASRIIKG